MRVHILGSVSLNGGDAAILAAQIAVIRRQWPDAVITVADAYPEAASRYTGDVEFFDFLRPALLRPTPIHSRSEPVGRVIDRVRLLRWKTALKLRRQKRDALANHLTPVRQRRDLEPLLAADLVAYTGGTSLTDNYSLSDKIFDLDAARRLCKPVVYLPQSAGPFKKKFNQESLRPLFASADLILLRDERSQANVIDVGADPRRCKVVPDIVFALARDDDSLGQGGQERVGAPRVAISVREWAHFEHGDTERGMRDYIAAISAVVRRLVRERDARVTFVSTCQGRPEYWLDDSALAVRIASALEADVQASVTVDRVARGPQQLIDFLSSFDAMLSTRLHGAISAVCSGLPTLAIAYEHKSEEVWRQLEMEDWLLSIDDISAEVLESKAMALLDSASDVRKVLARTVPPMRDAALMVGEDLARVVGAVR